MLLKRRQSRESDHTAGAPGWDLIVRVRVTERNVKTRKINKKMRGKRGWREIKYRVSK